MIKLKSLIKENYTPEDFWKLAKLQRAKPEEAMLRAQHVMGGGVMPYAIEHMGDLIHRMSEKATFKYGGYGYVKEKVDKILRLLTNPYGFIREYEENMITNAKCNKMNPTEYKNRAEILLKKYADEHRKLPTYNRAHKLAKIATIALAEKEIDNSVSALKMLELHLGNEKEWVKFAHEGLNNTPEDDNKI